MELEQLLDQNIRKIQNFPKEGILFYDVTTLFENAEAFKMMIDRMCEPYQDKKIDKVVGIDARGFLVASAMAYKLGAGISLVRKKGKLPYETISASYEKEYGPDEIEMHNGSIKQGEKVVIADDLIATGGTLLAAVKLVKQLGGDIVGVDAIINLSFLPGKEKLLKEVENVGCLLEYDSEEADKI